MDLKKWGRRMCSCGSRSGPVADCSEQGNAPSYSTKCGDFLTRIKTSRFSGGNNEWRKSVIFSYIYVTTDIQPNWMWVYFSYKHCLTQSWSWLNRDFINFMLRSIGYFQVAFTCPRPAVGINTNYKQFSTVPDYRLDDRVSIHGKGKGFFL
jgi:hypothetical protein